MTQQLHLIDTTRPAVGWRLDEQTKQIGRQGIAAARAALRTSERRYPSPTEQAA